MPKPKATSKGIVGFRPDDALRETLQHHANQKGHSIHEEARVRVISTFNRPEITQATVEAHSVQATLRLLDEKLTRLEKLLDAENPDLKRIEDRQRVVDEKVTLIAKDMATLSFLVRSGSQPMEPEAAKAWVKTNIVTYAIGQNSHKS